MIERYPYSNIFKLVELPDEIILIDQLGGFDVYKNNLVLQTLDTLAYNSGVILPVVYHNILDNTVHQKYTHLSISFSSEWQDKSTFSSMLNYTRHPEINYKNFVCSFNGTPHVSRKLLVSCLHKFGWFDPASCSKNFSYSTDSVDGHLLELVDNDRFYRKFFISTSSEEFFQTPYSFGHVRFNHAQNIYNLEHKITQSFLHIVSETLATSYCPFVTEKFLYSIVTRGLFLSYAQPGWHTHLEKFYGFKNYTKLFDYRFDSIQNPVERLVELMTMISKFSKLSSDEWQDLYLLEQDAIEYNYDHYFNRGYLKSLTEHELQL